MMVCSWVGMGLLLGVGWSSLFSQSPCLFWGAQAAWLWALAWESKKKHLEPPRTRRPQLSVSKWEGGETLGLLVTPAMRKNVSWHQGWEGKLNAPVTPFNQKLTHLPIRWLGLLAALLFFLWSENNRENLRCLDWGKIKSQELDKAESLIGLGASIPGNLLSLPSLGERAWK